MIAYGIVEGKRRKISCKNPIKNKIPVAELRGPDIKPQMKEPHIKIKKMYWRFRKDDPDFNPSVPHGHSMDNKYKLELWTGNIYEVKNNKLVMQANKKGMLALYNFPGFIEFVDECRNAYLDLNPGFILPPLNSPNGATTRFRKSCIVRKKYRYEGFIVELSVENLQ